MQYEDGTRSKIEIGWGSSEECGRQEIDGEPIVGDAWFGVDPVVDS